LGDQKQVQQFILDSGIKRLVLLEDFVGSGSQMLAGIRFAASLGTPLDILVVPLVLCPEGGRTGRDVVATFNNVRFSPVLELTAENFVAVTPNPSELPLFSSIRNLALGLYASVSDRQPPDDAVKPYGPFGFARTGSLSVPYANCPDNTLPLIHHSSQTWKPLFPRATRI
jgi:hypothetical protein